MRLSILFLLLALNVNAQTIINTGGSTTVYKEQGGRQFDSLMSVPKIDTTRGKAYCSGCRTIGRVVVASDSNLYYYNGVLWKKLSNQSTDTSSISTRIDARVKYTDTSASWFVTRNYLTATYLGSTNITTLGTITTGTWNGGVIAGLYGGTGVANSGKTITLGGNISTASSFTTSGANALTLTTTGGTNFTLPSGTTTAISSAGGTISSTGLLFSNTIQAKFGGSGAFTIDNSSSTGFCEFNMQTGGYEWLFQYNGTTFWRWYESGSGTSWRALQLMNKGVIRFDMSSGLNSVPTDGEIASDGTNLFFYKSKWRILDDEPAINATAITGTSNINLTNNFTTRYVDATTGGLTLTIIPTYAGQITYIKRLDASGNTVTVKMNSGNIDGAATVTPLTAQYKAVAVQWDGTNGYIIGGY